MSSLLPSPSSPNISLRRFSTLSWMRSPISLKVFWTSFGLEKCDISGCISIWSAPQPSSFFSSIFYSSCCSLLARLSSISLTSLITEFILFSWFDSLSSFDSNLSSFVCISSNSLCIAPFYALKYTSTMIRSSEMSTLGLCMKSNIFSANSAHDDGFSFIFSYNLSYNFSW